MSGWKTHEILIALLNKIKYEIDDAMKKWHVLQTICRVVL